MRQASTSFHINHMTDRTIKADVMVNCARIGFKP
jgi:hypothetical protein